MPTDSAFPPSLTVTAARTFANCYKNQLYPQSDVYMCKVGLATLSEGGSQGENPFFLLHPVAKKRGSVLLSTQNGQPRKRAQAWIPAFAGMTSSPAQNAGLHKKWGPRRLFSSEAGSRNFFLSCKRITLCFDVAYNLGFERIAPCKLCLNRYS